MLKLPTNIYLRAISIGALVAFAIGLPVVAAELFGLGSWGMIPFMLSGVSFVIGALALLGLISRNARKGAAAISLICATFVICSLLLLRVGGEARSLAFYWLAERSNLLVEAIKAYEKDAGLPPESLEQLVPGYLESVPTTGMLAYPSYEYEVFPAENARKLYWYDLGRREGEEFSGLWKYIDGEPEHSILVFIVDGKDTVVDVDTDRLPESFEDIAYDQELWANRLKRLEMIRSFFESFGPEGKTFSAVKDTLGPSDGTRVLIDSPWEIRVQSSTGLLNWDMFFYWPTEQYPDYAYGGSIETIGKWAYVHE